MLNKGSICVHYVGMYSDNEATQDNWVLFIFMFLFFIHYICFPFFFFYFFNIIC